jgi:hypothetical protein
MTQVEIYWFTEGFDTADLKDAKDAAGQLATYPLDSMRSMRCLRCGAVKRFPQLFPSRPRYRRVNSATLAVGYKT